MKAKITKITVINNASISAEITINDDDGTLVFQGERAIVSTSETTAGALESIKDTLRNIGLQIKAEKASKLKDEAESLLNKEIDLDRLLQ